MRGMESRRCEQCGCGIALLRSGARFCGAKCRVYASRAAVLPPEMTRRRRFVRYSTRKVPLTVHGRPASSTDSSTWSTLAEARVSTAGTGVGFVLGEGIGCIDLDHCISGGVVAGWAQEILDANKGTYTEVSMSGEGLHIFGLLEEAPGRVHKRQGRSVEVYSRERYIALTGRRHTGSGSALLPLHAF